MDSLSYGNSFLGTQEEVQINPGHTQRPHYILKYSMATYQTSYMDCQIFDWMAMCICYDKALFLR